MYKKKEKKKKSSLQERQLLKIKHVKYLGKKYLD